MKSRQEKRRSPPSEAAAVPAAEQSAEQWVERRRTVIRSLSAGDPLPPGGDGGTCAGLGAGESSARTEEIFAQSVQMQRGRRRGSVREGRWKAGAE